MKKKWLAAGVTLFITLQMLVPFGASAAEASVADTNDGLAVSATPMTDKISSVNATKALKTSSLSYAAYAEQQGGISYGDGTQIVLLKDTAAEMTTVGQTQTVPFAVATAGWYAMKWQYRSLNVGSSDHQLGVALDGAYSFSDMAMQEVPRVWLVGETHVLEDGTQVRNSSAEDTGWSWYTVRDNEGLINDPYMVYLTPGTHTLTLMLEDGAIAIRSFTFFAYTGLPDYATYQKQYTAYAGEPIDSIEAENFSRANSLSVTAAADMSSAMTTPYSYQKQLLNVLGGSNWEYTGQRVEWDITVPEAGLYNVTFRYKQTYKENIRVYRKLLVNGAVPFKEAEAIGFAYQNGWSTLQTDWAIYLEAGNNTLAMEVTLGDAAGLLKGINDVVQQLNIMYRRILMITGSTPDTYRDYHLDEEIPGVREQMKDLAKKLQELLAYAGELAGSTSAFSSVRDAAWQLQDMAADLRSVTKSGRLGRFKSNVSSLAALGQSLREQPLQIDSVVLSSPEHPVKVEEEGFFAKAKHTWLRFIASFSGDYNAVIGATKKDSVTIWTALGRDQLQILKNMTANEFTPKTGINAQIQLVTGSLIQAVLAGKGPDITLGQGETEVINYAMRGALVNLRKFKDYDEVMSRFSKNASSPYTYEDGAYAIPQTQTFDMMFVRTDILAELGLSVPKTWTDFTTKIFPVLQRDNLVVGVGNLNNNGALVSIFTTLLYQRGGKLYANNLLSSSLTTPQALEAFDFAVSLYDEYGVPTEYDFLNRFRTGEMPIAVAPYTSYNTLQVGAPEIAGLWEMVPIPGTEQADGSVNNTQLMSSAGVIMLAGTKSEQASWSFIRWWTSAEVQQSFGLQQEALLGPSGRYATANLEAMTGLSWSTKQLALLEQQRGVSTPLTHVPGSYFIGKSLNSALVTSVNDSTLIAREELMYWANLIDIEMARKQKEFDYKGVSPTGEGETE